MTREEEIIQAAKQKEKESGFTQIVKDAKGVNSNYGIGFLEGAEWADEHLRKGLCDIDKACDAYCKICGHYAHTVPTHICRQDCDYYSAFKKAIKEE